MDDPKHMPLAIARGPYMHLLYARQAVVLRTPVTPPCVGRRARANTD